MLLELNADEYGICRRWRFGYRSRSGAFGRRKLGDDNDLVDFSFARSEIGVVERFEGANIPVTVSSKSLTRIAAFVGFVTPGSTLS